MSAQALASYLGWAGVYAGLGTALLLAALRAVRGPVAWRAWPLTLATLFFVALTQHPFPDPAHMVCPVKDTRPLLDPFHVLTATWARLDGARPLLASLGSRTVQAALMNLLLCALIGAALARHVARPRAALLFGAGLSLGVELTQLTGLWGLYPCAYRQFDVDDLILNVAGVMLGFLVTRALAARDGPGPSAPT